ncbi:PAS domain-containing hybrid sensor histidine kinase/response regulator [Pantanalinema sp. GBBB05]|uniref:PAS domain-containing hybrid sensor histidine kinase/response regulator n=1 Tax=Pantanalinema sp. GBBB05 TaxID=2604139 RepID=UPI001DEF51B5|nr:PAS domain S-box protein [Pantanalinema sp. GBBB05]
MQGPEITEKQYQQLIEHTTELQQAYAALAEREAQYRKIVETANEGIWMLDVNARTTFVNHQMAEMLGYSETEMLGHCLYDFMDESVRAETEQKFARRLEGKSDRHECQFRRKDGSLLWALVSATTLFDQQQQVIGALGMLTDVTDRRRDEQALRESQTRNQLAMNVASMFAFEWDVKTDTVWRSPHCAPLLGLVGDEAEHDTGQTFFQRIYPDDRASFMALLQHLTPEQETYTTTYRFINPAGKVLILEESARGFFQNGQLVRLIGMTKDVTAREQTAIALRQSEYQLRLITEAIPHQVWAARPDGNVDYLNHRWFEYTGYTAEQLQDQGWAAIVHPDDLQRVADAWQQSVSTGEDYRLEARLRAANGDYRWFLGQALLLRDEQGQPVKWYGTNTDIHDRKQAEEALSQSEVNFRTLANSMPQIFWTAQPDGGIDYYNQRWYDYTGMTFEQSQGWGWQPVVHPEDLPGCIQQWHNAINTGGKYEIEYRFKRAADGEYRWHLGRAFPLRDQNGTILKWFGSSTDIHDQKQAIAERDQALERERISREQAEAANRIKDEFLAVLSHELRTPLNPILGWAKLLQSRSFTPEQTHQALATIERNAKLQVQLIDDLLDISRIIRGKFTLELAPVSLAEPIRAALETVRLSAQAKSIKIETSLDPDVEPILGDVNRLQQVVWNLLSNAIKFTANGGQITVRLERGCDFDRNHDGVTIASPNGLPLHYAQIQISDTGKGISPNFLPHVFELFRQQDSSTTRQFGGLGLGLAIVRQVVEAHGGTIVANSLGEGQGATFTIRLPLMESSTSSVISALQSPRSLSLQGVKILLVDDESDSLDLIQLILEQEGASVVAVASASIALKALSQTAFDLLISDIGMPDMDGYCLLRHLQTLPPQKLGHLLGLQGQLKAIALTSYAGELNRQQALEAGFIDHIAKPIEPVELIDRIIYLLN